MSEPAALPPISPPLRRNIRFLLGAAVCTEVNSALCFGAVLTAFALLLGASPLVIGLTASVGPLATLAQFPTAVLVNRIARRKGIVLVNITLARLMWVGLALMPFVAPRSAWVPLLLLGLVLNSAFATISGCAWNSWMRDLIPDRRFGHFFGLRYQIGRATGLVVAMLAAFALDHAGDGMTVHAGLIALGGLIGLGSALMMVPVSEPPLEQDLPGWRGSLSEPLGNINFRRMMVFQGVWGFAALLPAPFVVVFMLEVLNLPVGTVIRFAVLGQVCHLVALRVVGRLADEFSNISVLRIAIPAQLVTLLAWPALLFCESGLLFWIGLLHVAGGVSSAGIVLCAQNLAMRLAPRGRATSFLAVNAVACGCVSFTAPIIGGLIVQGGFGGQATSVGFVAVVGLSGAVGLASLVLLRRVAEPGGAPRHVVLARCGGLLRERIATGLTTR